MTAAYYKKVTFWRLGYAKMADYARMYALLQEIVRDYDCDIRASGSAQFTTCVSRGGARQTIIFNTDYYARHNDLGLYISVFTQARPVEVRPADADVRPGGAD